MLPSPRREHRQASELQLGQCFFLFGCACLLTAREAATAVYSASERPCCKEFLLALSLPFVRTRSPRSGLQEKAILNVKQPQILQTVKT